MQAALCAAVSAVVWAVPPYPLVVGGWMMGRSCAVGVVGWVVVAHDAAWRRLAAMLAVWWVFADGGALVWVHRVYGSCVRPWPARVVVGAGVVAVTSVTRARMCTYVRRCCIEASKACGDAAEVFYMVTGQGP